MSATVIGMNDLVDQLDGISRYVAYMDGPVRLVVSILLVLVGVAGIWYVYDMWDRGETDDDLSPARRVAALTAGVILVGVIALPLVGRSMSNLVDADVRTCVTESDPKGTTLENIRGCSVPPSDDPCVTRAFYSNRVWDAVENDREKIAETVAAATEGCK